MLSENEILQLPKRNNYHYNVENVDGDDCMVLYYKISDYMWNEHVKHCNKHGFDTGNQWLRILLDVDDFKLIDGWSISICLHHLNPSLHRKKPYVQVKIHKKINAKQVSKLIHRHILNPPKEMQVDHINHDTLDNRRCNLRLVTSSENQQNKNGSQSNSKTGIRGVSVITMNKNTKYEKQYYYAQVKLNGQRIFQKLFPLTPQGLKDAEQAVTEARLKYYTHNEIDKNEVTL